MPRRQEQGLHPVPGPQNSAHGPAVELQFRPIAFPLPRVLVLADEPCFRAPDRRDIEQDPEMGSTSDPAGVCDPLSVEQNNVGFPLQFPEGCDDRRTFTEKEIPRNIGEDQLFHCRSLLQDRQLRIAVQTGCCKNPVFRKSSINACDEFRFLLQGLGQDAALVPLLHVPGVVYYLGPYDVRIFQTCSVIIILSFSVRQACLQPLVSAALLARFEIILKDVFYASLSRPAR